MSVRVIKVIPSVLDYKNTLKRFKGYYCPVKIGVKKELKTQAVGYETNHTKRWKEKQ